MWRGRGSFPTIVREVSGHRKVGAKTFDRRPQEHSFGDQLSSLLLQQYNNTGKHFNSFTIENETWIGCCYPETNTRLCSERTQHLRRQRISDQPSTGKILCSGTPGVVVSKIIEEVEPLRDSQDGGGFLPRRRPLSFCCPHQSNPSATEI